MVFGKKGFAGLILKLFIFVLVVVIVVGAFWSLFSTTKKTAQSLTQKPGQYQLYGNSFIHPDLNLANYNFWKYQFENFVLTAVQTKEFESGKNFCYGTFYTDFDSENLKDWTLTFLQDEDDVIIKLKDNRNTLAASYPAKENNLLADTKLCIRTADGKEEDVHQITIRFDKEEAYYYTTKSLMEGGREDKFYYQPYLSEVKRGWFKRNDEKMKLFFYTYSKSGKLCIVPMHKNGVDNSLSHKKIKEWLSEGAALGDVGYKKFCDVPEELFSYKMCFYTPCGYYDSDDAEKKKGLKYTRCYEFSRKCGYICIPSDEKASFKCKSCDEYNSCTDLREGMCGVAKLFCGQRLECEVKDNNCVSGGGE